MIPENVTLIIKAPNQQFGDQNINCLSSWSVSQLKDHLAVAYPSKPTAAEQKIIYSGQLLEDHMILKDILRSFDTTYSMHLVCLPKRTAPHTPVIDTEGLRHRQADQRQENRPETRQNDQNHTAEMNNYISSFVNNYGRAPYPDLAAERVVTPNDPASMANHMAMMQQAYMQYMQQYAHLWHAAAVQPPPAAAEVPQQPPPAGADDGEERRDWLERVYAGARAAALLSLLCLYSSPLRLLLVAALAAAAYLYQMGFFRDLAVAPPAPAQPPPPANDAQPNDANANQPNPNVGQPNANVGQQNTNAANNDVNDNQQSLLAVTWMVVTTFFASLIPEMHH